MRWGGSRGDKLVGFDGVSMQMHALPCLYPFHVTIIIIIIRRSMGSKGTLLFFQAKKAAGWFALVRSVIHTALLGVFSLTSIGLGLFCISLLCFDLLRLASTWFGLLLFC